MRTLAYFTVWLMCVVTSCAASIGVLTGYTVSGFVVSGVAALVAVALSIHIIRNH